ncbi:MAG: alpha-L-arabinofuranosidase C-terminal domain-containing protein [Chloroflexota bacterium]|nr:alpha-L-arabinofuranosidase C-terminal domain-containing protein [Chloroflexota bacterium]
MARIKIDLDRQSGWIDRDIYGSFAEHLGRCIYGGIYEEGSPLSDERGFRTDVIEAVEGLHIPVLRWPGGNFVSGYHWMDGIGPKDQRPRRVELAWHTEEPNRFGTDEFIAYCQAIGAEPFICVNLGTGTLDEAAAWVEYCNGAGDTYYANLRRQNGHPEPYGVRYWGLGNEMYGHWQIGHKEAHEYALFAREAAKMMKRVDPSIKLVSCGWDGLHDWDRIVLEVLAPLVDYHSIHIYTGSDDHYLNIAQVHQAERCIQAAWALIQEVRYKQRLGHEIRIAYDEWNVWFRERAEGLEERYNLSDALAVATYLNIFQRNPEKVGMANLAQLVNVIAPIFTSPEDLFRQAIYWPLQLYLTHAQPISLDVWVESDTFVADTDPQDRRYLAPLMPLPYLDVSATCDESRQVVVLFVVNRHAGEDIETTIRFTDFAPVSTAQAYEVNGPDLKTVNDFGSERIRVVQKEVVDAASAFSYTFPAHSVTVLKLRE